MKTYLENGPIHPGAILYVVGYIVSIGEREGQQLYLWGTYLLFSHFPKFTEQCFSQTRSTVIGAYEQVFKLNQKYNNNLLANQM